MILNYKSMDYNDLMNLARQKIFLQKDICVRLGLTSAGFKRGIERQTMPFGKVAELCEMFHFSPNFFFGWPEQPVQGGVYAANITGGNTQNSSEAIRVLADQLKEKDRQISKLLSMLGKDGKK